MSRAGQALALFLLRKTSVFKIKGGLIMQERLRRLTRDIFSALFVFWLVVTSCPMAEGAVESSVTARISLKETPLDVAYSNDGLKLFVLLRGKVLVYSVNENKITEEFPVNTDFDRIEASFKKNEIVAFSSAANGMEIITLDFIQDFEVTGSPLKGPQNAPVTLAVFSDYQ